MAISKNIWLKGAKQKLGGVVLYQAMGETRMRELAPAVTNPRTPAQMTQRVRMANVVAMYKVSAKWMRGAFEDKPQNQSDYNAFVAANLATSLVAQTKAQAAANAAVVAPYKIASGSLNPISWASTDTDLPISDLYLGDLTISPTTTVGQFAAALEANNNLQDNMQLSLIQYIQQTDDNGTPYVICRPYEVILSSSSSQLLSAYMPLNILKSSGGQNNSIAVDTSDFTGGFAVILSKTNGSRINVSPAYIILTNDNNLYATFTTAAAWNAAVASYGEGQNIFLSSDSAGQTNTPATANSILYVTIGSTTYRSGDQAPYTNTIGEQPVKIKMAGAIGDAVVEAASIATSTTSWKPISSVTITGDEIDGTMFSYTSSAAKLLSIRVSIDGITYSISFDVEDYEIG